MNSLKVWTNRVNWRISVSKLWVVASTRHLMVYAYNNNSSRRFVVVVHVQSYLRRRELKLYE